MLKELPPGQIFLEKTPEHALFIPEIVRLLPAAKIIHLVRDPRDVVASLLAAPELGPAWAPRQVKSAVRKWHQHVSAAQTAGELLTPGQFWEIRYEDLYDNPVKWLREAASSCSCPGRIRKLVWLLPPTRQMNCGRAKALRSQFMGNMANSQTVWCGNPKICSPGAARIVREDLTLLERWRLWYALHRIAPAGLRYQKNKPLV